MVLPLPKFLQRTPLRLVAHPAKFRKAVAASGMSFAEIAERADVSISTVRRADEGLPLTLSSVARIGLALSLDDPESLGIEMDAGDARSHPRYRSVFLSYGTPDEEFASRLNQELARFGVKVFFFLEHAVPGKKLHRTMHTGVYEYDRVVVVCSKASLERSGVLNEIEQVLGREAEEAGEELLIPLTIDDYLFGAWQPRRADLRRQMAARVVADFREATEPGPAFEASFDRLLRALYIDDTEERGRTSELVDGATDA